ncbi:MAG TPA: DUF6717 family protein [Flavisolibacter sp.]|nr:DUF6717 family protein [Flavisolibacter sp.]
MVQTQNVSAKAVKHPNEDVMAYSFYKLNGTWYIDLPEYLEQGGFQNDLEMAEGAHTLLNIISAGRKNVTLRMSTQSFTGSDELELIDHCGAPKGGAIYLLKTCNGKPVDNFIWICDIALFVFGDMPDHIYVQQIKNRQSL